MGGAPPRPEALPLAFERAATIVRALQLAILFAPCVLTAPVLLYGPWGGEWSAKAWYALLRMTLEAGGAAFIKWGQWASTRYDVFPAPAVLRRPALQQLELFAQLAPDQRDSREGVRRNAARRDFRVDG